MRLFALTAAVTCGLVLSSCGGAPAAPSTGPDPASQLVTQPIEVRVSDGRILGNTIISATAGQFLTITAQDLADRGIPMDSVDHTFFALREANDGTVLGKYVAAAPRGALTFIPSASPRVLWTMTTSNGADYPRASVYMFGTNVGRRYLTVKRLTPTNNTYPDLVPLEGSTADVEAGLAMLNEIWLVGGVRLAQMTWVGDSPTADFRGGLAVLTSMSAAGFHGDHYFSANPNSGPIVTRNVTVAEAIESLHQFNDLFGLPTTQALFGVYYAPDMTAVGKDYVRFAALLAGDSRDLAPSLTTAAAAGLRPRSGFGIR